MSEEKGWVLNNITANNILHDVASLSAEEGLMTNTSIMGRPINLKEFGEVLADGKKVSEVISIDKNSMMIDKYKTNQNGEPIIIANNIVHEYLTPSMIQWSLITTEGKEYFVTWTEGKTEVAVL